MRGAAEALGEFVRARNEVDAAFRRSLLHKCWAADGSLKIGGDEIQGIDAVDARIAEELRDPEWRVAFKTRPKEEGPRAWCRWRVRRFDGEQIDERAVASVDERGRITELSAASDTEPRHGRGLRQWLLETARENPAPAAGLLGGALFLILRLPLGLFYGDLGVTPEEVGYGPQVLVPQALLLLLMLAAAAVLSMLAALVFSHLFSPLMAAGRLSALGAASAARRVYAVFAVTCGLTVGGAYAAALEYHTTVTLVVLVVSIVAGPALAGWLALKVPGARQQATSASVAIRRRGGLATPQTIGFMVVYYAVWILLIFAPIVALAGADSVRGGGIAGGRLFPWRALPAQLRWTNEEARVRLNNDCHVLRYLGQDSHDTVLFDTALDQAFRIPINAASVSVQPDCESRAAPPPAAVADPKLGVRTLGRDGTILFALKPFSTDVTGVISLTTKDPVPLPGATGRAGPLAIATQAFQGREKSAIPVRIRLSREAQKVLRRLGMMPVRIDIAALDSEGSTERGRFCFTLAATPHAATGADRC